MLKNNPIWEMSSDIIYWGISLIVEDTSMTMDEFRQKHSLLIENYQFIEKHLETIYAGLTAKTIYEGWKEVEKTNLNRLLTLIIQAEKDTGMSVFTDEETIMLKNVFNNRNYWIHNCYTDIVFNDKDGGPGKTYRNRFVRDLEESDRVRWMLHDKKLDLIVPLGLEFFDLKNGE